MGKQKIEPHRHLFGTMLDYDIAIAIGVTPTSICAYRRNHPDLPRFTCEDRRVRKMAQALSSGPMHIVDICAMLRCTDRTARKTLKAMGAVPVKRGVWLLPDAHPMGVQAGG